MRKVFIVMVVVFMASIMGCKISIDIPKDAHFFGISPSLSHDIPESEFDDYEYLGVKSVRIHLQRSVFGETYDFSTYDEVVSKCVSQDIEVMLLVSYESYDSKGVAGGAPWDPNQQILYYNDYMDLVDFLDIAVPHFSALGVKSWEIWNEENGAWHINPDEYAELITTIYEKFKYTDKWDESATVVFGGVDTVAWFDPLGSNGAAREYMQQVVASIAMENFILAYGRLPFDVVGVHPYGADTESKLNHNLQNVVFDTMGCQVPIWITEIGDANTDDAINADEIENYISIMRDHNKIERMFLFKYTYQGDSGHSFYSLVFDDGTKRQSFYRVHSVMAMVE